MTRNNTTNDTKLVKENKESNTIKCDNTKQNKVFVRLNEYLKHLERFSEKKEENREMTLPLKGMVSSLIDFFEPKKEIESDSEERTLGQEQEKEPLLQNNQKEILPVEKLSSFKHKITKHEEKQPSPRNNEEEALTNEKEISLNHKIVLPIEKLNQHEEKEIIEIKKDFIIQKNEILIKQIVPKTIIKKEQSPLKKQIFTLEMARIYSIANLNIRNSLLEKVCAGKRKGTFVFIRLPCNKELSVKELNSKKFEEVKKICKKLAMKMIDRKINLRNVSVNNVEVKEELKKKVKKRGFISRIMRFIGCCQNE